MQRVTHKQRYKQMNRKKHEHGIILMLWHRETHINPQRNAHTRTHITFIYVPNLVMSLVLSLCHSSESMVWAECRGSSFRSFYNIIEWVGLPDENKFVYYIGILIY